GEVVVLEGERQRLAGTSLVERGEQRLHATLGALGAIDDEWARARRRVAVLHEQERDAAEVVAVQMREQHGVELLEIPREALRRLEDARPTVEQERRAACLGEIRAVEASSRTEGVA